MFKIGRAQDQDVKVNDITVSRCHSHITFKDDNFEIDDNLSKFGTLIMLRRPMEILPGQIRNFQVGKSAVCCSLSFQEPLKYNHSNYLWQDEKEIGLLPEIYKQRKIQEKINETDAEQMEQQRQLRR